MTDDTTNLVLEHLRAIRSDIGEMKQRLGSVEIQLSAMGQQIGALTTAVYSSRSGMDDLRRRVERIEQRLELADH
ncbi:hypothetical protein [Thiorhodococcus minor]|uniref:Uncharacterized protein n=1 Tax=Thiorhodococcus minor TaxID=57489 RepID=A0A6M0JXJ7_9GAMM|nr:hypothetical protein [Thiorhodococcus minor]NEV62252.1 hypothetical protein [Thiorhodococcus minor]